MTMNAIKLTLLAAAGVALLAAAPASAQTTPRHATHLSAKHERAHAYPGGVYLLENRGAGYGAAGNTNAADDFQSQFNVDY
jgi:hypothetical protein